MSQVAASVMPISLPAAPMTVAVYRNGKWTNVLKSGEDFPISIKMEITPAWAADVLATRNKGNRSINPRRVKKYVRDILAGNFHVINNGIGFYEDGSLADAQHRLSAIVEANQPVTSFVVFGLTRTAGKVIDDNRPRSDRDVATLSGLELSPSFVSSANYILEQIGIQYARSEKMDFYERHKEALTFASNGITKRFVCRAPILAVVARAWYSADRGRLVDFMDVLETGKVLNGDEDEAAFQLREFAIKNSSRNDGPFRLQMYQKTMSSLRAFMSRQQMSKIYGTKDQVYLLPEEIQMRRDQETQNRSEARKIVIANQKKRGEYVAPRPPESYGG
jgi:hypothetical protein